MAELVPVKCHKCATPIKAGITALFSKESGIKCRKCTHYYCRRCSISKEAGCRGCSGLDQDALEKYLPGGDVRNNPWSFGKFPASPAQMPSYRRDWYDKMLEYIRKGDEAKIRTEFQKDPTLRRTVDDSGRNLMHACAEIDSQSIATLLYAQEKDLLEQVDKDGNTPLHIAALKPSIKVLKVFLSFKPNLYILNKDGDTAYMALEKKLRIRMFGTKPDPKEKPLTEAQKKALTECYDAIVAFEDSLFTPFASGDTSEMRKIFVMKVSPNYQDSLGRSLFAHVCASGQPQSIIDCRILQMPELNVNVVDRFGASPIHCIVMSGDKTTLKSLLSHGKVDVNAANALGETALHLAALKKNHEIIRMLLTANNVNVNLQTVIKKSTPLHYAVYQDDAASVEALLNSRPAPDMRIDSLGFTPIDLGLARGKANVLPAMNSFMLNYNLCEACHAADVDLVTKILSDRDANVSFRGPMGRTPLHCAIYAVVEPKPENKAIAETPAFTDRAKKILGLLLDHNSRKPNTTDIEDDKHCTVKSLSKLADDSGDFGALIVKAETLSTIKDNMLINDSSDGSFITVDGIQKNIQGTDDDGNTIYHLLAREGRNVAVIPSLRKAGIDRNWENANGETALHVAVKGGHLAFVEEMLKDQFIEIDRENREGNTALHLAASAPKPMKALIVALLTRGANPHRKNHAGATPMTLVRDAPLRNEMMKANAGRQLLEATKAGDYKKMRELLERPDMPVSHRDEQGQTALHIAVLDKRKPAIDLLLGHCDKEDLLCLDNNGNSPLKHAGATVFRQELEFKYQCFEFLEAAKEGDLTRIRAQSTAGVLEFVHPKTHNTALHEAAQARQLEAVRELIALGANVNAVNLAGKTALHFAMPEDGKEETVQFKLAKLLLEEGCDSRIADREGRVIKAKGEPLQSFVARNRAGMEFWDALKANNLGMMLKLLNEERKKEVKLSHLLQFRVKGLNALHWAAKNGWVEGVQHILKFDVDVDSRTTDSLKQTAFELAAPYPAIRELLGPNNAAQLIANYWLNPTEAHANIVYAALRAENASSANTQGVTLLHIAATRNDVRMAQKIIELGGDVNKPIKSDGSMPLHLAAMDGHSEMVAVLLKGKNVQVDALMEGRTPLMLASCGRETKHADTVALLLRAGAEVNVTDANRRSPVWWAAAYGADKPLELLLQYQADPSISDWDDDSPLLMAVQGGHINCVQDLLEAGAPASKRSRSGNFPLLEAARKGNQTMIEMLIKADKQLRQADVQQALQAVAVSGNPDPIALLVSHGASPDPALLLLTVLYFEESEHERAPRLRKCIDELLRQGANPSATMKVGENAKESISADHVVIYYLLESMQRKDSKNVLVDLRNTYRVLEVYKRQSNNLEVLRFAASGDAARLEDTLTRAPPFLDLEYTDRQGHTALWIAVSKGIIEATRLLLQYKASLDSISDSVVHQRVKKDVDRHKVGRKLLATADSDDATLAKQLLDSDPTILSFQLCDGDTIIHMAAKKGAVNVLRLAVKGCKAENLDACNKEGEFPLLLALGAKKNAVACLEILLDAGADLLQKFKDRTLLEINQSTHKRSDINEFLWPRWRELNSLSDDSEKPKLGLPSKDVLIWCRLRKRTRSAQAAPTQSEHPPPMAYPPMPYPPHAGGQPYYPYPPQGYPPQYYPPPHAPYGQPYTAMPPSYGAYPPHAPGYPMSPQHAGWPQDPSFSQHPPPRGNAYMHPPATPQYPAYEAEGGDNPEEAQAYMPPPPASKPPPSKGRGKGQPMPQRPRPLPGKPAAQAPGSESEYPPESHRIDD